jgi:hypothetical protein
MAAGSSHAVIQQERIMSTGKWLQKAAEKMKGKGTVGSLHKALGVPQGKKIPLAKMETAKKDRPGLRKKIQFAENVRK